MTTLTQIADQSGDLSATWGWKAWAIFIVCVLILLAGWWLVVRVMAAAPTLDPEPSGIDRLDGKGRSL